MEINRTGHRDVPARQRLTVPQPDINVCGNEHVEAGHTNQEGDSHGILCEMRSVFLVLEPYKRDRFVRFHAMRSVLFCVAAFVFSIAWDIVVRIMISISGWTAVVLTPIGLVISLPFFLILAFPDVSGVQPVRVSHSVHRRDWSQAGGGLANHHNRSMQLWNN
jgi:uncharacterized membrane protein